MKNLKLRPSSPVPSCFLRMPRSRRCLRVIPGYQAVIDAAKKEGKVLVYSVTDTAPRRPLIKDFESLYGVKVGVQRHEQH